MKLGFKTKGDFQAHYFGSLLSKYFEGGNADKVGSAVNLAIRNIMLGLSEAWDNAEEQTKK